MFNQAHVAAELIRLMIGGDHPVDLKLMRFCVEKLHCEAVRATSHEQCSQLVDRVEVLDQAQLFNAPSRLVTGLRADALQALADAEPDALPIHTIV